MEDVTIRGNHYQGKCPLRVLSVLQPPLTRKPLLLQQEETAEPLKCQAKYFSYLWI